MTRSEDKGADPRASAETESTNQDSIAEDGAAEDHGADVRGADAALTDIERHLATQQERYLRLAAEYDNYRKRTTRERLETHSRAQGEIVKQMLDALDDLARFARVDPAATDSVTVVQGVELVERKLFKALSAAGLEVIDPVDQGFDPTLHEAIATEPALSPEDDQIVSQVYQQGYLFNGQLLRPARVVVKQWTG